MAKQKIAILGGGMAALTAAYYLSRTDDLRTRYEVTLHQIGWRLGGKGSTGRTNGRIEEHGLHIWFGYYDNAFRLLREVFGDWTRDPDHPLKSWRDALKPQSFTPIGPEFFPLNWATNDGVPGDGHEFWTPWMAFTELLGFLSAAVQLWIEWREEQGNPHTAPVPASLKVQAQLAEAGVDAPHLHAGTFSNVQHALDTTTRWAKSIGPTHQGPCGHHIVGIAEMLRQTHLAFAATLSADASPDENFVRDALDIFQGYANGFICDFLIAGKTALEVDAEEFRAWIVRHGTTPSVAASSCIARALYDTMFQYEEGDLARPNYAAGTSAQCILRTFGCYKGAALWEMQGGMGEVVVSPLYQLLISRGVTFKFFREVKKLALDEKKIGIAQIHLARQADTIDADYRPTFKCGGLDCWPSAPFWEQLKRGEELRKAGVNFESPWSDYEPAGHEVLQRGVDFDIAILAITAGGFKNLNGEPAIVDELTSANPRFKTMCDSVGLVPSMAVQVWSDRTLQGLGWSLPKPAAVAGVEPLDIWADMSQTLAYEEWAGNAKPQSVHYLTGVMYSTAYRAPRSARSPQHDGEVALTKISKEWLSAQGPRMWPRAVTKDGQFDWDVLFADSPLKGPDRIATQYIRANISPAECCVGSGAGTTQHRLKAGESGFENLTLAGCWIDTGYNTTCIEAAVMSGMQAARAICGEPVSVLGEDLLQRPGHSLISRETFLQELADAGRRIENDIADSVRWFFGIHPAAKTSSTGTQ